MPHRRTALLALLAAVAVCAIGASTAAAAPTWAPAATATIHPGVQVFTDGAQCTANFVFADATDVYIGQAAHCSGTGAATDTDGCTSASLPIGTPVDITAADHPGNARLHLVADHAELRRGGPRHLRVQRPRTGADRPGRRREGQSVDPVLGRPDRREHVRHRARRPGPQLRQPELRGGITVLSPKEGTSVGDVARELSHLAAHTAFRVTLQNGTEPFRGPLLPV
jgi:hypothetical protein